MQVPLLDLKAIHDPIQAKMMAAIEKVVSSQHFILGPEVQNLEARLAKYCGTRFALGVSSGSDALLLALMALDIKAGDEIITSPFTFFATAGAIARLGAKPVFVDIDPETYNLDARLIAAAVTSKSRAIIPVHLYGQCADMSAIMPIAKQHKLAVVEDAAQALGASWGKGRAGSFGDVGCFSFFPTKNLGALGDGGLITTNNEALFQKMTRLRVHGSEPKYYHKEIGGNFRIDALQAAVLNVKLDSLDGWSEARRKNADHYATLFQKAGLTDLKLPKASTPTGANYNHVFNQYVVRAPQRDALIQHLKERGVGTEVYYPVPLHLQECFNYLGYKAGRFPVTEKAAQEAIALPIYPGLTPAQQEYVVESIKAFYQTSKR